MPVFNIHQFDTLSGLVEGHLNFLQTEILDPFVKRIEPLVRDVRGQYVTLVNSFLNKEPLPFISDIEQSEFYCESKKRDAASSLRRFALGNQQARGLHLRMRQAYYKLEHLYFAQQLEHPTTSLGRTLEDPWKHVFTQMHEAFSIFGVPHTFERLNDYRARALDWIHGLAVKVRPLQKALNRDMPCGPKEVAGHVNTVLLYILLSVSGYPNPQLAFRFFTGAPIVSTFDSPALRQRIKHQGDFTDDNIRRVAADCRESLRSVKEKLTPEAAAKSHEKMAKEFDSGTLLGPFDSIHDLVVAIRDHIRQERGFEQFWLPEDLVVISPQFTIAELHAYEEALKTAENEEEFCYKVRNIFNARKMNALTSSRSTYVPCTHGDVSVIILHWVTLFSNLGFQFALHGWPADFAAAYRQMPIQMCHAVFSATCYFDYELGCQRYGFYKSLPFGSSLAPAGWSELVVGLSFLMAFLLLSIVTHCVDDVANFEAEETVASARTCFLEICKLLGLNLDMQKSLTPRAEFIYLGLLLVLPASLPRQELALKVPEARLAKLLAQVRRVLDDNALTSGEAASMRGRLFFYSAWFQEARGYLSELAARQYSSSKDVTLTCDLKLAFQYFERMLQTEQFLEGIRPERYFFGRKVAWLYTDGANTPGYPYAEKGIGGVIFPDLHSEPVWYGEHLDPTIGGFSNIAAIEMYAVLRALRLFSEELRGKALFLFIDNMHAVGCLLKRSASIYEDRQGSKRVWHCSGNFPAKEVTQTRKTPEQLFYELDEPLRRTMNIMAQLIWKAFTDLDVVVWIEYVWTEVNLADPPSRGQPPPMPPGFRGIRVGGAFEDWVKTF